MLTKLDEIDYNYLLCLGDVAATGPQPWEVLQTLKTVDTLYILGYTDAFMLEPPRQQHEDQILQQINDIDFWAAIQRTGREELMPAMQST